MNKYINETTTTKPIAWVAITRMTFIELSSYGESNKAQSLITTYFLNPFPKKIRIRRNKETEKEKDRDWIQNAK